ncbi:16398_t:CDS:1, partial [Dentiscutata heterogama]
MSRLEVVKTITRIKEQAQQTNDKPAQIMQTAIANSSQYIYLYLPSTNTLRQTIQRICYLNLLTEPGSLESLIIPEYLRKTLDRADFLINDTTIGHNKMLIFMTPNNIRYLNQSL